jgi:hypothetical protein
MKILGTCKPPSPLAIKTLVCHHNFYVAPNPMVLGKVYSDEMVKDDSPVLSNFFQLLTDKGYTKREPRRFDGLLLVSCKGSVNPHIDPGLGLIALWLVHRKPLHRGQQGRFEQPVLYADKEWSYLSRGEIVIFDANHTHAWLSNYHCSMIIQAVKKARRTHNVEAS